MTISWCTKKDVIRRRPLKLGDLRAPIKMRLKSGPKVPTEPQSHALGRQTSKFVAISLL
jgi:hypothetical protein